MSGLMQQLKDKLIPANKKIVFPESMDERILRAAAMLSQEGILIPVLVGSEAAVKEKAAFLSLDISGCMIVDPEYYPRKEEMIDAVVERRKGKVDAQGAEEILQHENYFGTMLVYLQEADGLVSGAVHSTSDTVRPALQLIKTKPGAKKTSGVFLMIRNDEKYIFADCAINIAPDANDLAEIAVESAKTAKLFQIDPRIAMLSFSTKGSAKSEETERVIEALKLAKEKDSALVIDGEFQFDAAFVPSVAKKKAPESVIQGDANVFIFPSLEAGNIGYKIAQRLGGFDAIGPIIQGLNQPVNDLSRGCSMEDVYKLAIITAAQSLQDD